MIRSARLHTDDDPSVPSWNVAVIDGRPEVMVNVAMIAEMARHSPLGPTAALAAIKGHLPDDVHAQVAALLSGGDLA